jgi:hypothetical protein
MVPPETEKETFVPEQIDVSLSEMISDIVGSGFTV